MRRGGLTTFKLISLKTLGFKRLELEQPLEFTDGRILIFGRNESGKSTIMEAVHYALFGYPLYPNKKAPSEDIICYGRKEALVELTFSVNENRYLVRRIIKAKGANTHELRITHSGGALERIVGSQRVNKSIIDNLHGLDSEALLNSCLVMQKELGKLESGNKNERIKAMTNLLNIKAFLDAREDLKDSQRELEKNNYETKDRLNEAENAKNDYEKASSLKESAEDRTKSIDSELVISETRLTRLAELLKAIEQAKNLATEIEKKNIELRGIQQSIKEIEAKLDNARAASRRVHELESQLPSAQAEADRAKEKTDTLERLLKLESQLRDVKQRLQGVKNQIKDAKNRVEESEAAGGEVSNLETQIKEYEQSNSANNLLPSIEEKDRRILSLREELNRTEKEKSDAASRLESLKDSSAKLMELERRVSTLTTKKSKAARNRVIGVAATITGLALTALAFIYTLLAVAGVPFLLLGTFLALRSKPSSFDTELKTSQTEAKTLLGDQQRVADFTEAYEKAQQSEKTTLSELTQIEEQMELEKGLLPARPSDYASIIKNGGLPSLRSAIVNDLQTLSRLTAERQKEQAIFSELGNRLKTLLILEDEARGHAAGVQSIQSQIDKINFNGIFSTDERRIRDEKDEANRKLTAIGEEIRVKRETASQVTAIDSEIVQTQTNLVKNKTKLAEYEEERRRILAESGANPSDEQKLSKENEDLKQKRSGLLKERELLERSISESEETMNVNRGLCQEYPALQAKNSSELFEIEAMSRAMTILDSTRDSIMYGVKSSIENHMAQFLPTLTENRYSMAMIDEEEYQIEVYDREAKSWRRKGVFSGGTQDQFSLALRLAFALSTIPETRGARPGFIFLDEPLTSFDSQRREGFMNLIKNELSRHFPQIIVISHLEQLQTDFPTLIQLDSGRIV